MQESLVFSVLEKDELINARNGADGPQVGWEQVAAYIKYNGGRDWTDDQCKKKWSNLMSEYQGIKQHNSISGMVVKLIEPKESCRRGWGHCNWWERKGVIPC